MTPVISIVMPVYNAGRYLRKAIESILVQTYSNFELILIDDGATDGSGSVCDAYQQQDSRVKVIHQKNKGICEARNVGLREAKGKYIAFCDHDDTYESEYLAIAVSYANKTNTDLLKFGFFTIITYKDKPIEKIRNELREGFYNLQKLFEDYQQYLKCVKAVWNGVYMADIIKQNSLQFDPNIKTGMEDYDFNLKYMQCCKSISCIVDVLFNHYAREEQSTSLKFSYNKLEYIQKTARSEYEILSNLKRDEAEFRSALLQQRIHYMRLLFANVTRNDVRLSVFQKIKIFQEFSRMIPFNNAIKYNKKEWSWIAKKEMGMCIAIFLFDVRLYALLALGLDTERYLRNCYKKFRALLIQNERKI